MSNVSVVLFFRTIWFTIVLSQFVGEVTGQQFPYQASLRGSAGAHFCGGAILKPGAVVSVAHCVMNRNPADVVVVVGASSQLSPGDEYEVTWTILADIALLTTDREIVFGPLVQPIAIADRRPFAGVNCVVSGWAEENGSFSANLESVNVITLASGICQLIFGPFPIPNVCALTIGACLGDFGAPLVCNGKLAGLYSGTSPCAFGVPDLYASVDAVRTLI